MDEHALTFRLADEIYESFFRLPSVDQSSTQIVLAALAIVAARYADAADLDVEKTCACMSGTMRAHMNTLDSIVALHPDSE